MTIDEAIKDLRDRIKGEFTFKDEDNCQDMKLGIEALKRCKRARENGSFIPVYPLEGESET